MDVKTVEVTCCEAGCGIIFWIASDYNAQLVSTKRSFYCPNGHSMHYLGESDRNKIRRLEQEVDELKKKVPPPKRKYHKKK